MEIDLYCKTCRNAKNHKQQDNEICWSCVAMGGAGNYKESKTNADRIRAKTEEELALFIEKCTKGFIEPTRCDGNCLREDCYDCWLDWLKEEVDT